MRPRWISVTCPRGSPLGPGRSRGVLERVLSLEAMSVCLTDPVQVVSTMLGHKAPENRSRLQDPPPGSDDGICAGCCRKGSRVAGQKSSLVSYLDQVPVELALRERARDQPSHPQGLGSVD